MIYAGKVPSTGAYRLLSVGKMSCHANFVLKVFPILIVGTADEQYEFVVYGKCVFARLPRSC